MKTARSVVRKASKRLDPKAKRRSLGRDAANKLRPLRVRSSGPDQSVERILDAAWEVISRRGAHKLSMTDVCDVAGLARGTLYRYFPTKERLFEAMFQSGAVRFEQAMRRAIEEKPALAARLHIVSEFQPGDIGKERARRMTEAEPGFVLDALARYLPHHRQVVETSLQPVFEHAERKGVAINRRSIAEVIVRLQMSFYLWPRNAASQSPAAALVELLQSALKVPTSR